jgi:hypothetical protein
VNGRPFGNPKTGEGLLFSTDWRGSARQIPAIRSKKRLFEGGVTGI